MLFQINFQTPLIRFIYIWFDIDIFKSIGKYLYYVS